MSEEQEENTRRRPKVFLSYARQDLPTAKLLAMRLQDAGVSVAYDNIFSKGDDVFDDIQSQIRAADFVVLLVSAAALASEWVKLEYAEAFALREFSDRSITIIAVILDDVKLPESLRDIAYLDFHSDPRAAMDALVPQLSTTVSIDFSRLSGSEFEDLIGDLLVDLGLRIERHARLHDFEFDFKAYFQTLDPFGISVEENWFIEVKHHKSSRLSVSNLAEFRHNTRLMRSALINVALVTSSQITSAAREMLIGSNFRVVEGVDLKRILLTRPHIVRKYFGALTR